MLLDGERQRDGDREQFFLFNTFLLLGANNVQLNPTTRSGYTLGPGQQELEPFTY